MKTRYIVGTRPQDAPADHLIHGDGAEWFIEQNQNLDATELHWVSMEEAVEGGYKWYDHNMPKLAAKLDLGNQEHREWLADKFMEVSSDA